MTFWKEKEGIYGRRQGMLAKPKSNPFKIQQEQFDTNGDYEFAECDK
jgi:hypothetical protein